MIPNNTNLYPIKKLVYLLDVNNCTLVILLIVVVCIVVAIRIVENYKKIQMQGDKQALVVWAIGKDGVTAPEYDSETMYGAVFCDEVRLAQAYQSCSYDQLRIVPYVDTMTTGKDISNGVVGIQMTINPTMSKSNLIQTDIRAQLQLQQLGDVILQFDLILYCIPSNMDSNWIAFAFANNREVC